MSRRNVRRWGAFAAVGSLRAGKTDVRGPVASEASVPARAVPTAPREASAADVLVAIDCSSAALHRSASPLGGDVDLCNKLKDYLQYRSRSVNPPPTLAEAWDQFYAFHTPRIWRFLSRSGLPEADREDCLQDVWREVVVHLADLQYDPSRARLSTWLITVARNRALNMLRRRCLCVARVEDAADLVDRGPGPVAECEGLSTQAQVRSVLAALSAQVSELNFQVLYQRRFDGRTNAEVAQTLGMTPERVRFRLHRMKQKFRQLFERSASNHFSQGDGRRPGNCQEN